MNLLRRNISAIIRGIAVIALIMATISAVAYLIHEKNESDEASEQEVSQDTTQNGEDSSAFRDVASVYELDDEDSVVTMYLTVSEGTAAENTNHSWLDINTHSVYDYEALDLERYQVNALLQVGDEAGPTSGSLGYDQIVPNATVQIRGQSSSKNPQKNYKIELRDNKGTWRGQKTIALNKHMSEGLRFRNKLCFDLMKKIPQHMSLRTQFVHLYVKDTTSSGSGAGFEDYGLYTQVEQPNKAYMKAHGLDKNGQLYKVNNFEFYRNSDVIKLATDPTYNKQAFENLLEVKGNNDHTKLINMLTALNDETISPDAILDNYFDRENLAYWMAFEMLVGNIDCRNRNFYIYSPYNSSKWYLLPWDYDGSFYTTEDMIKNGNDDWGYSHGVGNFWGTILFKRALKSTSYREELDRAVEDIKNNYMTPNQLNSMIATYRTVTDAYVNKDPDNTYSGINADQYNTIASNIPDLVEYYYQSYKKSLKEPLPFYIGKPSVDNGLLNIVWDGAYDFNHESISYSAVIARDYNCTDIIASYTGDLPYMSSAVLPAGQYYVKVVATNKSGYSQVAFDYYNGSKGTVYGVKCFFVLEDGRIVEDTQIEN